MPGSYTIPIGGLKEGTYTYDFTIGREFFEGFEGSEVREGSLSVKVIAEKRTSHLDLTVVISGMVMISCDRCLGIFSHPVESTSRLLVKFSKNHDDSDPDIISVSRDENELSLEQYFYENILLALPIQRMHPLDSRGKSTCDPDMMIKLHEHEVRDEETADPRWDELRKLINNN